MATVLLLVNNPSGTAGDQLLRGYLEELGHAVVMRDDSSAVPADYPAAYAALVMSPSCAAFGRFAKYRYTPLPALVIHGLSLEGMELIEDDGGLLAAATTAYVVNETHPVHAYLELSNGQTVTMSGAPQEWRDGVGIPVAAVPLLQVSAGDTTPLAWTLEVEDELDDGTVLTARRVAIKIDNYFSPSGTFKPFFQASVRWLLGELESDIYPEDDEPGVGLAPTLRVGNVTTESAELSVDPLLSEYLQVRFRTVRGLDLVEDVTQSGAGRTVRVLSGLPTGTQHYSIARVLRTAGWSPWSPIVGWRTLGSDLPDVSRGCPPPVRTWLLNPDANPPNFEAVGFYRPLPGEPLRGVAEIVFRWVSAGQTWDIDISDDLGLTWTTLAENVEASGADGDLMTLFRLSLDTTLYPDGMDYRLRARSNVTSEVWTSLSFPIDNANQVFFWRSGPRTPEDDVRWGRLWNTQGVPNQWTNGRIWWRTNDGGIAAVAGHTWSALIDRLIPPCRGGDITYRFYVWSGEGGLATLQGRDDTELFQALACFFATGETPDERVGMVAGIDNLTSWFGSCCDDYLTSVNASGVAHGNPTLAESFYDPLNIDSGGFTGVGWINIARMFFKTTRLPRFIPASVKKNWTGGWFRAGPAPGVEPEKSVSCVRRYEVYAVRVRVELDPMDLRRARIRMRLAGPGVESPPAPDYWHKDVWITAASEWTYGFLGLVSYQAAQALYGDPNGARVFMSWSALPLDVTEGEPPPEEELPPLVVPEEGRPCTIVLQVYEDDRETLAWEVGTDRDHLHPYLCLPEHYGEQEIDVVNGAATIGQVEVVVIDKAQTVGDQDSGWLTERLSDGADGVIHGFRCRLLRFISPELGWVVLADGPAGVPRMDDSFAGYRWTIRDTRETERKVRAFVKADTSWVLPMGVEKGWWYWIDDDGDDNWLVETQDPLVGEYVVSGTVPRGRVSLEDYWPEGFQRIGGVVVGVVNPPQTIPEEIAVLESVYDALHAEAELLGDPLPVLFTWPHLEVLWRLAGSEDPWTVVQPTDLLEEGESFAKPRGTNTAAVRRSLASSFDSTNAVLDDGTPVRGAVSILVRGNQASGTFPTSGQTIEVAIRWRGTPTEFAPLHIEFEADGVTPVTTGKLLRDLYDGVYSYPDPVTDEVVPTGIRYDPDALAQMTDPVHLRITERVDDARAWAEEFVYAPTGWVPALDRDGRISPVSQIPPDDPAAYFDLTPAITQPVPNWNAGERIVNILALLYPRYYPATNVVEAASVDGLLPREVTHEFRDPESIKRHGEQIARYDGQAFSAPGDEIGRTRLGVELEPGYAHAQDRKAYVFDRFRTGAQAVQLPVMRTLHVQIAPLTEQIASTLRAGDWVRWDSPWLPDYVTRRRGMQTTGQIVAIDDVDCAWRVLLIEEVLPVAFDSAGNVQPGAPGGGGGVVVPPEAQPLAAPSGLMASVVSSTEIGLAWTDNSEGETGFVVERSPDGLSGWTSAGTVGAGVQASQDTTVLPGVTYYYRVRAVRGVDTSDPSNVASATTSAGIVGTATLAINPEATFDYTPVSGVGSPLTCPTEYATVEHDNGFNIGSIDHEVRMLVSPSDWSPTTSQNLFSYGATATTMVFYAVLASGGATYRWDNHTGPAMGEPSTPSSPQWIRIVHNWGVGTEYYTSDDYDPDNPGGETWDLVASEADTNTSARGTPSVAPITIGETLIGTASPFTGSVHRVQMYSGDARTLFLDVDFTDADAYTAEDTLLDSVAGHVVTIVTP